MKNQTAAIIASKIAVGAQHACGIEDKQLHCWGKNNNGQLMCGGAGNPLNSCSSNGDSVEINARTADFPATLQAVAAGDNHTCVIAGAELYCWGGNALKQLGVVAGFAQAEVRSAQKVVLPTLSVPATLRAQGGNTCVIDTAGELWCWGDNRHKQLGTSAAADSSAIPQRIVAP